MAKLIVTIILCISLALPISAASPTINPGPQPLQTINLGKTQVNLLPSLNARGQPTQQILIGTNISAFWTDPSGAGNMTIWEATTDQGTVRFHSPVNGHFLFMEVRKRLPFANVTLKFSYSQGKYRLFAVHSDRFQRWHQDIDPNCADHVNQVANLKDPMTHISRIGTNDDLRKALEPVLDAGGCKSGKFSATHNAIIDAILKIEGSNKVGWESAIPTTKGSFLQCIRYYGFRAEAAKIYQALTRLTAPVSKQSRAFGWGIRCEDSTVPNQLGSFDNDSSTVILHTTPEKINQTYSALSPGFSLNSQNAIDVQAKTIFHEMFHWAHQERKDENLAHLVDNCCYRTDNQNSTSCTQLGKLTHEKALGNAAERTMISSLSNDPNHIDPKGTYATFREAIGQAYGNKAQELIEEYKNKVGALMHKLEQREDCKDGTNHILGACTDQFKELIQYNMKEYFSSSGAGGRSCLGDASAVADEKGPKAAEEFCHRFEKFMNAWMGLDPKFCPPRVHDLVSSINLMPHLKWLSAAWAKDNTEKCPSNEAGPANFYTITKDRVSGADNSFDRQSQAVATEAARPKSLVLAAGAKDSAAKVGSTPISKPSGSQTSFPDATLPTPPRPTRASNGNTPEQSAPSAMAFDNVGPLVPNLPSNTSDASRAPLVEQGTNSRADSIYAYLGSSSRILSDSTPIVNKVLAASPALAASANSESSQNLSVDVSSARFASLELKDPFAAAIPATNLPAPSLRANSPSPRPTTANAETKGGSYKSTTVPTVTLSSSNSNGLASRTPASQPGLAQTSIPNSKAVNATQGDRYGGGVSSGSIASPKNGPSRQSDRRDFLTLFNQPYNTIYREFDQVWFTGKLIDQSVAIIDHQGRWHGPKNANTVYRYDAKSRKLVLATKKKPKK